MGLPLNNFQRTFKLPILIDDSVDEAPEVIVNWCSVNDKEILIHTN